ncbi:MAG: hypothetical protein ACRD1G_00140, partial [Acidimicrobiales bacterium]
RYSAVLGRESRVEMGTVGNAFPSPAALVELAHPKALREEYVAAGGVEPIYLRKPDVAINWEQRRPSTGRSREELARGGL